MAASSAAACKLNLGCCTLLQKNLMGTLSHTFSLGFPACFSIAQCVSDSLTTLIKNFLMNNYFHSALVDRVKATEIKVTLTFYLCISSISVTLLQLQRSGGKSGFKGEQWM